MVPRGEISGVVACVTACRKIAAPRRERRVSEHWRQPQPAMVFVGWILGMANGPMRAYTSFGTP
jgi:hypothetical protein